ncbi:MAG: ribosome maturation factor RimM [Pyrinomonadaceae bacterium]|jgi:16S rRNA processing protein RimM|nr:ribosome maturation factor RimM [Pyrinomonadaceae bacterium]
MDLVTIAKIVRTRGLRGEVVADLLTDFPERFSALGKVFIKPQTGENFNATLEKFWFQKGRVILKFKEFQTIEKAENLRNCEVCVSEEEIVELDSDEFYDWELENCEIITIEGEKIGYVKELMRTGGTENLVVQGKDKDYLIPFAETICTEVDIENKVIKVDLPSGLLEF